jgi:uncharacterized membrane protein
MTDQITLEEALKLVIFRRNDDGTWCIDQVLGSVWGSVGGNVWGSVKGIVRGSVGSSVLGSVGGNVGGNVKGIVDGTIGGREWEFVETPKKKLKRLIDEGADTKSLLEAINQLEESDD